MRVELWQDTLTLKTYVQGPADPHPNFERQIYPYTMQDALSHEAEDREYRAIHLENCYLHVIVLPDLGGRVFSVWDRVAQREVFYRNNVIKPAMVALRGAWISGGIEFNFFNRGHTHTTMSPVSFELSEDGEGVSVTVSDIDLRSRARWAITIGLEPNDPRLHQHVWLRNRMPWRQRYYFWANSALPATDDLQLVYPARKARFSREGIVDYPLWKGRDLSLYRNHPVANDIFTLDVREDFFGCYYPESDAGLVHLADKAESVGKKFFTWGTEDAGMIWVDLLTDDDGQYVELQSGRFVDQSVYEYMLPFQQMDWREYWWPVHGMGGWQWASDEAVLNFDLGADGTARIGTLTWRRHEGAEIAVSAGGVRLWAERADLDTHTPFTAQADLGERALSADELVVTMEGGGEELLRYVHPPEHTRKPSVLETGERDRPEPTPEEVATAGELHLRALHHDLWGRREEARRLWVLALERDPALVAAHVGLGLLDYREGRAESAREQFEAAMKIDRQDYEAAYYLALALLDLGDAREARLILERLVALGRCDREAAELLLRCGDRGFEADADRPELLRDSPEQWLEVASEYAAVGQTERAIDLLRGGCEAHERVAGSPLVHYTLAHYREQTGDSDGVAAERALARECDPLDCFPWRLEDMPILRGAIEADASDWLARYLLGTWFASRGRTDDAMDMWLAAAELDDGFEPLMRNLGWGSWHWREDLEAAEAWYARAIKRAPEQYRLYVELDRILEAAKRPAMVRLKLLRSAPEDAREVWQVAARTAAALVAVERWDEALALMERHRFIPWEGARGMRDLWVQALLGRARALAYAGDGEAALQECWRALEYPRNIGVGRRVRPRGEARIWQTAAEIADRMGDEAARDEYLERAESLEQQHRR